MDLKQVRFQYQLYIDCTVQQVLAGLIKNFGMATILQGLAEAVKQETNKEDLHLPRPCDEYTPAFFIGGSPCLNCDAPPERH